MSTAEKINFRPSPNQESARPLSTYDNLSNNTHDPNSYANDNNNENTSQTENKTSNHRSPFGGISFQFDDLKEFKEVNPKALDYDEPSENGKMLNVNNNTDYPNKQMQSINGGNEIHDNHGHHHTVTTIAQNHSSSSGSTSSSSSSSSDSYRPTNNNNYENAAGHRNKPVHSVAKSQFFGLHKPNDNNTNSNNQIEKGASDDRDNTGESSTVSDEEPLIRKLNNSNKIIVEQNLSPYQNVAGSSSSYYGQDQIFNVNMCTCRNGCTEIDIQQYDNGKYKCNNCLRPDLINDSNTMNNIASSSALIKPAKQITLDANSSFRVNQSLTQAVYMSTTVPQNMKGSNIGGSHLPTRNSLRHSRMLVGKKSFQVKRRNPLNIRHPKTVRYLFFFHLIVGLIISSLGLWLCWWAHSTPPKVNPYWSGLVLMLSGILGSIIMIFKPIQQKKLRQFFIKLLRISSTIVTFIAAICTLFAAYFALTFLITFLSPSTNCAPSELLVTSSPCKCTYSQRIWGTELLPQVYRDLNCDNLQGLFAFIQIASALMNTIGFSLCCALSVMLCIRHKPVKRVPYTSSNSRQRL